VTGACQVAVVGSFMMDLAVVAPRRPQPGETLVGSRFGAFLGGKGCNQAIVASRAGASAAMIGRLGADDFGRRFLACLSAERIDVTHVTVDEVEGTGVGLPLIEDGGENSIVIVPRANGRMTVADVTAAIGTISSASVLLLQLELPLDVVVEAAARARAAGTLVVLNPAPSPEAGEIDRFAGLVDVLIPNEVEVAALSGVDDPRQGAGLLRERLGCSVVVTMGDQGAWVVDGGEPARYPAHRVEVVDTVGAGDAFCGALGARLATGAPLREAVEYASAAAALAVTKLGAEPGMPRAADIDALRQASSGCG
jgi:ribokinase